MRIVVTGASGFLGRALLKKLACHCIEVVGVSRHDYPGFVQIKSYADAPTGDVLVHLAEINDRCLVEEKRQFYEKQTLDTIELLRNKGYCRTVYSSSAVLYGDQNQTQRRVGDSVHVTDTYTRIKYASECAVLERNGIVARLTNLYGPGMSRGNVLSTILNQISVDGPVRVHDATPVRDFLWVDDAAQALAVMALGTSTGIFNVGTGIGTSIAELVRIVIAATGQSGRRLESTYQRAGISHLVVDIAQTTALLGWVPATNLPKGIEDLVKLIKKKGAL
jgi:UDP-glucose 4-epimerase